MLVNGEVANPKQNSLTGPTLHVMAAWNKQELAMNPNISDKEATRYFEEAESLANRFVTTKDHDFALAMSARLLLGYLPTFDALRHDEILVSDDHYDMRSAVGQLYRDLKQAPIHTFSKDGRHFEWDVHEPCITTEDERRALAIKLGTYMLASRSGIVLYPGSIRESLAGGELNIAQHHDAYVIENGEKIPIKIRYRSQGDLMTYYDSKVLYIAFNPLLNDAFVNARVQKNIPKDTAVFSVIDWMDAEAKGVGLPESQRKVLARMSDALRANIANYIARPK